LITVGIGGIVSTFEHRIRENRYSDHEEYETIPKDAKCHRYPMAIVLHYFNCGETPQIYC
jgi:hypothetical protein